MLLSKNSKKSESWYRSRLFLIFFLPLTSSLGLFCDKSHSKKINITLSYCFYTSSLLLQYIVCSSVLAIRYSLNRKKETCVWKMNGPCCSNRGQWFAFPCQVRCKHQDTGTYSSPVSGYTSSAVKLKILISEKRKRKEGVWLHPPPSPLSLTPLNPHPSQPPPLPTPCPPSSYLHYAFFVYAWAQLWLLLMVWGQAWLATGYSK